MYLNIKTSRFFLGSLFFLMNDTFLRKNVVLLTDADVDGDITEARAYVGFRLRRV